MIVGLKINSQMISEHGHFLSQCELSIFKSLCGCLMTAMLGTLSSIISVISEVSGTMRLGHNANASSLKRKTTSKCQNSLKVTSLAKVSFGATSFEAETQVSMARKQ